RKFNTFPKIHAPAFRFEPETDQKRGKYAPFWPVFTYIPDFRLRESDILDKSSKISRLKNIQSSARQKERLRRKTELRHSLF
ncbi:hypothetical protein, partial [Duncaniella freteri]|uniref:hypothetical protein n=1 Tax=Duncaniella freteri TaxID=2530391 RepID=UPI002572B0B0